VVLKKLEGERSILLGAKVKEEVFAKKKDSNSSTPILNLNTLISLDETTVFIYLYVDDSYVTR